MCNSWKWVSIFSVIFILTFSKIKSNVRSSRLQSDEDPRTQPVFTSLKEVLDLLEKDKYQREVAVHQLLFAYFNSCQSKRISYLPQAHRKPFIVVEGNHRTAKRILAMRLSRRLGASLLNNPPKCLSSMRNFFPTGGVLLRAYFSLSAYALAQGVRRLINIFPVVGNGYWLDQQTYAIARTYGIYPPPSEHPVYQWPKDLLKPDIIFFVEFPDNLHKEVVTTRAPDAHKTLAFNALLKMNVSGIVMINTTVGHEAALQEMERHIEEILTHRFPVQWLNVTKGPSHINPKLFRNKRVKQI